MQSSISVLLTKEPTSAAVTLTELIPKPFKRLSTGSEPAILRSSKPPPT